jgi:predicted dehydrogenase
MHFLIIGISSIVLKRVLPALIELAEIERIHLASRRSILMPDIVPPEKRGRVFEGYDKALAQLDPCVVYVSLPNSLHAEWAQKSLEAGFHVVVDKPAFTTLAETEKLLALAEQQGLCLAEAMVWNYHPQIDLIKNILGENGLTVTRIIANFSFPRFAPTNFRLSQQFGGGSLLDLGPYAASCGRVFGGAQPKEIICRVNDRAEGPGVDTSFSLLARYESGRAIVGHFGFNTEYCNFISLLGPGILIGVDRVFTVPADFTNQLQVRRDNLVSTVMAPAGDNFGVFLKKIVTSIQEHSWPKFYEPMLKDAQFIHQMMESARAA